MNQSTGLLLMLRLDYSWAMQKRNGYFKVGKCQSENENFFQESAS